jgi:perosamine synthetase
MMKRIKENLKKIKIILKSLLSFLFGKRIITFYFQTVRLSDALLSLWYSFSVRIGLAQANNGREKFLHEVNKMYEYKAGYLFGSARSALYALLKSLKYEENGEVIVTGFTCDVVPNAVIQAGLIPVYADIDPKTFCMDPQAVPKLINNKTKAIIIQHTFGIPADIEALLNIANKHSLYVIEDCAVSLGSRYKGNLTGTFGDAAIFSFELSKTITACRGGLLLINTEKDQAPGKLKHFYQAVPEQSKNYSSNILFQLGLSSLLFRPVIYNLGKYIIGQMFKRHVFKPSTPDPEKKAQISDNYLLRLSNEQAIILGRQWDRLGESIKDNQNKLSYYFENIKGSQIVASFDGSVKHSLNLIRLPLLVENRRELYDALNDSNIELGLWFTAPISSGQINHEVFKYVFGSCPVAEKVSTKICNIPMHRKVEPSEMVLITDIINRNIQNPQ